MRIWVIGAGTVGEATGRSLAAHGNRVIFVDTDPLRLRVLATEGLETAAQTSGVTTGDLAMVCVPTPASVDGYDLTSVLSAVREIARSAGANRANITLIIRSTVPPGTCNGPIRSVLDEVLGTESTTLAPVVHLPEFLREAHALRDSTDPRMVVVGAEDAEARSRVCHLMAPFGAPISEFESTTGAELVKCAHNAFNATKISFWNEMYALATALGADANAVATAVSNTAEASWSPLYGIRGGSPYGGKCLPKDVQGFAAAARALAIDPVLLDAVDERNRRTSGEHR